MTKIQKFNTSSAVASQACPHCGMIHTTTCPRIKWIEYEQGPIKKIVFHEPESAAGTPSILSHTMNK